VPDLLGFGHSQRVELPAHEYSHAGQAALLAQLVQELGLKSVDVAGSSYGGGVAAQLALDFPDIVRRLVIVDGQVYELGGGLFQAMGRLPWGIGSALTRKALVSPFADEPFARIRGTTAALQALNRVAIDARIPEDLHELRLPVLLVWGEKDRLFPLAQARRLLRTLPNATLEIIPRAGHSPQEERPDEVAARIRAAVDISLETNIIDRAPQIVPKDEKPPIRVLRETRRPGQSVCPLLSPGLRFSSMAIHRETD
jgi:pimeloyl-ACP methyl ester carboxylesterase